MSAKVKWYRGAWWVDVHDHGKRRKKRIGTTTAHKRQAEEIAKKLNAALVLGTFGLSPKPAAKQMTLREVAARWLTTEIDLPRERALDGAVAPQTAIIHRTNLSKRILLLLGDREIGSLGVGDVQALYEHCLERQVVVSKKPPKTRPLSARTIEMTIGTLGRVLAHAEAHELVSRNVVAAWKRSRGRRRGTTLESISSDKVLDSRQLAKLLETARQEFPDTYLLFLFLADTGVRIGEASALRWIDVDIDARRARIARSFSDGKFLSTPKTGRVRSVELSERLAGALRERRPDLYGPESLVFPSETGGFMDPHNFRARVFRKVVEKSLGKDRDFSPHGLRHTFASLHLARGTNLKWIQTMGGWSSAKLLLDLYGHFLPTESTGYADALSGAGRPYTAPQINRRIRRSRRRLATRPPSSEILVPRAGIEPATRCLEGNRSVH